MQLPPFHANGMMLPHPSKQISSSTPNLPSMEPAVYADVLKIQRMLRCSLPSQAATIQDVVPLPGKHLHQMYHVKLSSGSQLVLKSSVRQNRFLRHERDALETEARVLSLLSSRGIPLVPRLIKFEPSLGVSGSPFLLTKSTGQSSLSDVTPTFSARDYAQIERQLGHLAHSIAQLTASSFGTLNAVASGGGFKSWRICFLIMVDSIIQDAEDLMISLPYTQLKQHFNRLSPVLEDVRVPNLVVADLGDPSTILVDVGSKEMASVVDFSSAFWGDVLISRVFESPSMAFLEGYGCKTTALRSEKIKKTLYIALTAPVLPFVADVI